MVLENNWFWSTFILERQLLNLNDTIFCCCFLIVSLLVCFVCLRGSVSRSDCLAFVVSFFFSSTQVAGQRDNRANGRDRGEKNFNWNVTSVFKVDSLTRIQTIIFELFFLAGSRGGCRENK